MTLSNLTFRKMTFMFVSFILILLFLLQFALIQNYSKEVASKIGEAAYQVSRSTIEKLFFGESISPIKAFAFSTHISRTKQEQMVQSISNLSNDISISLQDGQKDKFISINSSGKVSKVDIPRTEITNSLESMINKLLVSTLIFILFGILIANYFSKKLGLPLKELEKASGKIGEGEFGFQIKGNMSFQSSEIKNAVSAFNEMSKKIVILQKENDALQKQNQHSELAEITRGMAHTIRNPLNTLNLAIDEITTSTDKANSERLKEISKKQIHRIDRWVRSMMDIMASEQNLSENLSIKNLLNECIDEISQLKEKTINVKLSTKEEDNLYQINANKSELKSLITGLISNAIESTSQALLQSNQESNSLSSKQEILKSKPVIVSDIKIYLEALEKDNKNLLKISLFDNGIGFSEKIKSKLFTPHNTDKTYGSGMGLYLAQRVLSLKYQGELKIKNNPNSYTGKFPGALVELTLNDRV